MAKKIAKKVVPKNWTDIKELELDRCYTSIGMEIKDLADRFNCSTAEIRRKLKEMKIYD